MVKKVAIVGYSVRLPEHTNKHDYWQQLLAKHNMVTTVDNSRWAFDAYLHPDKAHPGTSYTFAAGSVGDVSQFDPSFFGISPREAAIMDPQQRYLLMLAWEAIEDAGLSPAQLRGQPVGVYVGVSSSDYAYRMADDLGAVDSFTATGNTASIAANRISYAFDLRGPSMSLDTACSSSLVAFHQACLSIRAGETSMALAGGISLHLHPYGFVGFSKASMLSPTGRCQVFDAAGDGYVRSEGGGLFLLKDYDLAVADGDRILAVVLNSAVNTDGHKQGITVPNPYSQAQLIERTMAEVGLSAHDLDYVEAHGTGTAIGDPIETQALGLALGQQRRQPLPIGSIKSNMGHLETASGAAGLVKLLYAMQHRTVLPTIGINDLNPRINFKELNLRVNQEPLLLPAGTLHMSVNSFGFGGSNAHVILQSPPTEDPVRSPNVTANPPPLLLSARSATSLRGYAQKLAQHFSQNPTLSLYDTAYQLYQRRELHPHRGLIWATGVDQAMGQLQQLANQPEAIDTAHIQLHHRTVQGTQGVVFVFSGNGSQWVGMGEQLLQHPVFAAAVNEVDQLFAAHSGVSLLAEIHATAEDNRYQRTDIAQPALFALQVAMVRLLAAYGVQPAAVVGHSVGEVAAAWASGALSLSQAVHVIYERSRLQHTTQGLGGMTAVSLSAETMQALLDTHGLNQVYVAGANSNKGCTLAGTVAQLERAEAILTTDKIRFVRLDLDYAFHSPAMDSIEADLLQSLADLRPQATTVPMYSGVNGAVVTGQQLDAHYWWHNIRQPVLFEPALNALFDQGFELFVEVGPHPVLRGYVNHIARERSLTIHFTVLAQRQKEQLDTTLHTIQQLRLATPTVDLDDYFPTVGAFVELPTYAWDLDSYWHPTSPESYGLLSRHYVHHLLGYALPQQPAGWESQLDTERYPYLAHHVVGEHTLLPGAAFVEIALAAAQQLYPDQSALTIENLSISTPLVLHSQPSQRVQTRVDSSDGRLSIRSKPVAEDEGWNEHAQARLLEHSNFHWQQDAALQLPSRPADFDAEAHWQLTQQVGLAYGPSFRAIKRGWHLAPQQVLVELHQPDDIAATLTHSVLHPALLDSCFQSIIHLLTEHPLFAQGAVFVPVQVESAYVRTDLGPIHYAHTQCLRLNPHSMCARFDFYNAHGQHIAQLDQVRFRSMRVPHAAPLQLSYLDYVLVPQPLQPALNAQVATADWVDGLTHTTQALAHSAAQQRYTQEIDPLLDSLADLYTHEAVWAYQQQQAISQGYLAQLQSQQPKIHALLDLLISRLVHSGEAHWEHDQLQLSAPITAAAEAWRSMALDYGDAFAFFLMVARVGMHLPQLLHAETTVASLRPHALSARVPLPSLLWAEQSGAFLHGLNQQALHLQQQLPAGQRLRLLELNSSGPWWVESLLNVLDPTLCDVYYLSTDEHALQQAHQLAERFPTLTIQAWDPAESPPVDAVDVLLLQGDTSDPAAVSATVAAVKQLLLPQGMCLFYGVQPSYWQQLSYHDLPLQGVVPADAWLDLLQADYTPIATVDTLAESGLCFWVGTATQAQLVGDELKPELTTPPPTIDWVLLADTPASLAVAKALGPYLAQESSVQVESVADYLARPPAIAAQQLVYMGGLHAATAAHSADQLVALQQQRCMDLARLAQHGLAEGSTLWVLCSGANLYALYGNHTPKAVATDLALLNDATVWGFSRTLMNEADTFALHLVDVAPFDPTDQAQVQAWAQQLALELTAHSAEQEVIYTALDQRYVPRLQTLPEPAASSAATTTDVQLHFDYPGQLRHLYWQPVQLAAPIQDQVQVRIHTTGLNFRDVMYTLGMLSDEAVEHGFAGASLGLEFAGVVEAIGPAVTGYAVGDRVVGFGAHSFGSRTLSSSSAMAPLPDGMSFESAATLPSTFLTVYYALHHLARLEPGERVLIHGAAGGVGIAAIQYAQYLGAEVYATAGSAEKRDFLRLMGVEHIYDSRSLRFADDILAHTGGQGVDVVLNSLAGEAIQRNLHVLASFGRFLELGKRDFYQNSRIGLRPFRNNISYFGIDADQLMQAKPALTQRLFKEVMQLLRDQQLSPLPYVCFDANHVVEAFRYMQQARQIGKIVVTYHQPIHHVDQPAETTPLELDAHASYLISGGLGGFGLRTAQWLVEKGARHLVLISRRGASSPEAQEALAHFAAQGVQVSALACDITQSAQVQQVFEHINQQLPPLKGIIHAATVIDDSLIQHLTAEQLHAVLAPKVLGAMHLHQCSLQLAQPLDLFVVYSSATTLFGNLGQSNYVAANYWLEALMGWRLQQGLAATNVRWGAIEDVGFLARNQDIKEALQNRMGGSTLPAAVALEALEAMLVHQRSHLGVMELDWSALDRFLPTAHSPKFSYLAHLATQHEHDQPHEDWQAILSALSPEQRLLHIEQLIKTELAEILRMPVERIDSQQSLYDMGLDSLLGVELALAIEGHVGVRLPAMALSSNPTIARLADRLVTMLLEGETTESLEDQISHVASQHHVEASDSAISAAAERLQADLDHPHRRIMD